MKKKIGFLLLCAVLIVSLAFGAFAATLKISTQPKDFTGPVGSTATFTVKASGTGLSYQWQFKDVGGSWKNSSATTATATCGITAARDGRLYRCIVTDSSGNTVTSSSAKVIVGTPLKITAQPQNGVGKIGDTATFTVKAEGDGLTYQWQYSDNDGKTWTNSKSTADTATCEITAARDGRLYRCVITDSHGSTVTSSTAEVIIGTPLTITAQPKNFVGAVGGTATFTVKATGEDLTYQWQYSDNNGETWKDSSATTATATCGITAARDGRLYRCIVSDSYGVSITSDSAAVVVGTPITITTQPKDYTGAVGDTAVFSIRATGDDLTYQWQYSDNNGQTWKNSSSTSRAATCAITAARDGRLYRCIVTDASGASVTSESAKIIAKVSVAITTQPKDFSGAVGETATFTVKATGDGLTYQWQYSDDSGKTWTNSSSTADTATCKITAARDGRQYRCIVKAGDGASVTSSAAKITVKASLAITTQPKDFSGAVGETATFTVKATGDGLTYLWQYKDVGGDWKASSSTTATATCKITDARNGRLYRCIVSDSSGKSVTSSSAKLTVGSSLAITTQPKAASASGSDYATFTVKASGSGLKYQWQYMKPSGSWTNCTSATTGYNTATLKVQGVTGNTNRNGYQYRCVITDNTGASVTSKAVKLTVTTAATPEPTGPKYTITYMLNDDYLQKTGVDNPNPSEYYSSVGLTLDDLEVPGYRFLGWYYSARSTDTNQITEINAGETGNKRLYAHWELIEYSINYVCDMGNIEKQYYTTNETKSLASPNKETVPSMANYVFLGWTSDEFKTPVTQIPAGSTGNKTFYANWTSRRNMAYPVPLENPVIVEDSVNGQILFAYELGTIRNVPLYTTASFQSAKGLKTITSETTTKTISTTDAKTIAETIANATTASHAWSLSEDWNNSTSVNEAFAQQNGWTQEEANTLAKTSTGTYSLNSSIGGADTKTHETGAAAKLTGAVNHSDTHKTETGQDFKLDVNGKYGKNKENSSGSSLGFKVGDDSASGNAGVTFGKKKGSSWELGAGAEYGNYIKTTDETTDGWSASVEFSGSVNNTESATANWNFGESYTASNSVSSSQTVRNALSEIITSSKSYGETYSAGGSERNSQEYSSTDSKSNQYANTLTYYDSDITTQSKTYETNGEDVGYYRIVCAGTVHVYGVVGYDIATHSYYTYTYSFLDEETYDFLDYSYSNSKFEDFDNGVLPFEIPYEVHEYVSDRIAVTDGLTINTTSGLVTGYTGSDTVVIVPAYISVDNGNGTSRSVKVTGISANAFKNNTKIRGVVLSDYITSIPDSAFAGCTSLQCIYCPGVTSIGSNAFAGCTKLIQMKLTKEVTSLGDSAFDGVQNVIATAANMDVAHAVTSCGAQNITLNISNLTGQISGAVLTVPSSTDSFTLQGDAKSYSNLKLDSSAASTTINRVKFVDCTRTPIQTSSANLRLDNVTISGSSISMLLTANKTNLAVYDDNTVTSTGSKAIVCRSLSLNEVQSNVDCKLNVSGNILYCGTFTDVDSCLNQTSGQLVKISEEEFEKYAMGSFTIFFNANGGSVSLASKEAVCYEPIGTLPTPTRDGCTFDGWYTQDGTKVTENTTNIESDTTLKAHWKSSGWVNEADLPDDAQITDTKYTYDLTSYTTSSSSSLSGWTLYNTTSSWSDYGAWSNWQTTAVSGSNSRQVETRTVTDRAAFTRYHYYYYRYWNSTYSKYYYTYSSSMGGTRYDTYTDGSPMPWNQTVNGAPNNSGYLPSSGAINYSGELWYYNYEETIPAATHTEYRYRDRTLNYTYYYYKVDSLESTTDPTGQTNVSNVQKLVKYQVV